MSNLLCGATLAPAAAAAAAAPDAAGAVAAAVGSLRFVQGHPGIVPSLEITGFQRLRRPHAAPWWTPTRGVYSALQMLRPAALLQDSDACRAGGPRPTQQAAYAP